MFRSISLDSVFVLVEPIHQVVDRNPTIQSLFFSRDDSDLIGAGWKVEREGFDVGAGGGENGSLLFGRKETHSCGSEEVDWSRRQLIGGNDGSGELDQRFEILCDSIWVITKRRNTYQNEESQSKFRFRKNLV